MPKAATHYSQPRRRIRHDQAMSVLRSFRVIYGSVRQHFRAVEERCGVSGSQLWILQEIGTCPGIGVSALAAKLGVHQSTCSLLVDKLVRKRHVTKARLNGDQRRVGLRLSRKGRETVACAPGPAAGVLPQALGRLSRNSLQGLQRSLLQVIRKLELDLDEAAERPLSDL